MTTTNFNKAVCDELMNNAFEDDMYQLSKDWFPMGDWVVPSQRDGIESIRRTYEIGNYAVVSDIRIFDSGRMTLETWVYLHDRTNKGELLYDNHREDSLEGKEWIVRMFVDSVTENGKG